MTKTYFAFTLIIIWLNLQPITANGQNPQCELYFSVYHNNNPLIFVTEELLPNQVYIHNSDSIADRHNAFLIKHNFIYGAGFYSKFAEERYKKFVVDSLIYTGINCGDGGDGPGELLLIKSNEDTMSIHFKNLGPARYFIHIDFKKGLFEIDGRDYEIYNISGKDIPYKDYDAINLTPPNWESIRLKNKNGDE